MIGILLTVLVAVLVYLVLAALTVPLVGIIGAILVLIAGIPSGGFGMGSHWSGRRGTISPKRTELKDLGPRIDGARVVLGAGLS